jgi:hypothetical protein
VKLELSGGQIVGNVSDVFTSKQAESGREDLFILPSYLSLSLSLSLSADHSGRAV